MSLVQNGDTGTLIASGSAGTVLPANTTIGNTVVLLIGAQSATAGIVSAVSSSIGTFTKVVAVGNATIGGEQEFWVCLDATGAAKTITVTTTGAVTWRALASEWPGIATSAVTGGTSTGTSAAPAITVTPVEAGDLIFTGMETNRVMSAGPASPWTFYNAGVFNFANGKGLAWQQVSSTTPITATWAQTSDAYAAIGLIVEGLYSAPSIPTLTSPANAIYDDVAVSQVFTATYNSTDGTSQNKYALRLKLSGGSYGYWNGTDFSSSTAVWNTITTLPGASFSVTVPYGTTVPSGTFTNGYTYDWSFASQEAGANDQGSFATDFVLNTQAAPTVTVTAPTGTTSSAYPAVTWTETLGSTAQTAYQVIVEFGGYGTIPGAGAQVWNSGVVASNALATTTAVLLSPNTYRFFVQVTETNGMTSAWGYSTTTVSGLIAEVPGTYDVAIAGHGYMIDTTFEFGRRDSFRHSSIPAQRDATDVTNQPGEATINPAGLWRSEFNDWSMGSGQLFVDRKDSQPNRYHHSQGTDVFTRKWYASLLKDTTQLIADTDTACQILVVNSYIFKLNSSGVSYSTNGTSYTAITGLSGTPVMMCSDGFTVYIACGTGGVYTAVGGTVAAVAQLVNVTSNNVYFVAYCSNVLLVANGASLYQVTTSITSWPTALITQAQATWTWNSACGGNGWIYIGGFAGASGGSASVSSVFKTQFMSDGTTLTAPTVATPLPPGEIVYSLFAFVNYILMGTSLGMRFCQTLGLIDPSGQDTGLLKIGPIIPNLQETCTKPVRCFTANQRFVYFGWSNYSASTVNATDTCTGLGWLDISTFTGEQTPAYSSNLMVGGTGEITSLDWFNGAPVFTVQGQGVYTAASTYVSSGNIYSGYIAFRIPDQKILVAYSVDTTSTASSVSATINQDDANTYSLGTVNGTTNLFSVPQIYGELFETDLTLNATSSNTVPTVLRRATLQAFPAITAGKYIITALRFWDEVETRAGRRGFYVYQELAFLESLRQTQTVVTYQEGTNTWSVVVDNIDFVEYMPSGLPAGGFQGINTVTLKTASSGLLT